MTSSIPPRPGDGWLFNPPPGWSVPQDWEPEPDWEGPAPEWPPAPPDWQWWKETPGPANPEVPAAVSEASPGLAPLGKDDPTRIGEYRLVGRLGSGGMGVVYAGVTPVGRRVAVKVVHPAFAGDDEFRARFARETAVLSRVTGTCVAQVIAADVSSERPWLATEYIPGPTLDAYIRTHGPLQGDALYGVAAGLAEAIVAIHAASVVHRDLKPANVILSPNGPRVVDFGIARALDETAMTRTGMIIGSPGWISPEEYRGDEVGPAADIHNWGLLVTYAASGTPPFGTGRPDVLATRVMTSEVDTSKVPDGLRDLVNDAVAKNPDDRPKAPELLERVAAQWRAASAGEAATRVEDPALDITARLDQTWVLTEVGVTPWPDASPPPTKRRLRSYLMITAAATAVAVSFYSLFAPWRPGDQGTAHTPTGPSAVPATGKVSTSAPATTATPVSATARLAYAAIDGNKLLTFDAASGKLLNKLALPVNEVSSFYFDEATSTLYFTENHYTEDNNRIPLGGYLYRMRQGGPAEIVAKTKEGVSFGEITASGDTVIYASYEPKTPMFNSKSNVHVLQNGKEVSTLYVGSEPVHGISLAPDGRIGLWTHELGSGGASRLQVVPVGKKDLSDATPIHAIGGNCQLSHLTWVADRWMAVESLGAWPEDGKCRDGDHIVTIDPITLEISSVGASVPSQSAIQIDRRGRVFVWTDWPGGGYILDGDERFPMSAPQYNCTPEDGVCPHLGGAWPGDTLNN